MAVTGVWKIAIVALGPNGEGIVNTFYYGPDGTDASISGDAVASAFDGVLPNLITNLVTSDWHYYKTTALCVHGANVGKSGDNNDSAPLVGGLGASDIPIDVCIIGKTKANGVGKHAHGRKYFSPISNTNVDVDGRYVDANAIKASWHTLAQQDVTPAADPFFPVLWDPVHTQAIRIVSDSIAPILGVQKRRRLRLPN